MKNKILWSTLIAALLTLLIWLVFFWTPSSGGLNHAWQKHSPLPVAEAPVGGDFTLQSPGGTVSLADLRGKVVLIYFGYTFCPDICPTSLATQAQALSALTPVELSRIRSFFITVDPERDTLEILKTYVPYFHPGMTGLSGTPEQIAQVAGQYGARYMLHKPDTSGQYSVDHSAFTYIIGPDGKLASTLAHGSSPQQIVTSLRAVLKTRTP